MPLEYIDGLPVIVPTEADKQRWRDYIETLPTVTLPAQDLVFDDGASALPATITLEAPDGRRFTFDKTHHVYWEILDSLEIVEE